MDSFLEKGFFEALEDEEEEVVSLEAGVLVVTRVVKIDVYCMMRAFKRSLGTKFECPRYRTRRISPPYISSSS